VKYQTDSECSAAIFTSALDFEGFASDVYLAYLSAPGAGEVHDATESGAELEGSWKVIHEKYLLT